MERESQYDSPIRYRDPEKVRVIIVNQNFTLEFFQKLVFSRKDIRMATHNESRPCRTSP